MRRRLRQQLRVREALLLDLGALVFELQRQGRREPELLQAKAAELNAVDHEVRALADALETGGTLQDLVATGIAGSCGSCGSLLSMDARYCSACGAPAVHGVGAGQREPRGQVGQPEPHDPALSPARHEAPGGLGMAEPAPAEAGRLGRIRGRLGRRNTDG